jgi:hypothetical protein
MNNRDTGMDCFQRILDRSPSAGMIHGQCDHQKGVVDALIAKNLMWIIRRHIKANIIISPSIFDRIGLYLYTVPDHATISLYLAVKQDYI